MFGVMSSSLFCLAIALLFPGLLGLPPTNASNVVGANQKHARLYNRHTHRHLRIIGSKIDAEGNESDQYAQLILETVNSSAHMWIKSSAENTFLCVDSQGAKLVVESTPSPRCLFAEEYHNGFAVFQSVHNSSWYIGFKKNGQIKPPQKTSPLQKAAWFLAR